MSARLTTAIRIADAAKGILQKTKTFPEQDFFSDNRKVELEHIGVEPMLLALSMELALKAWFVFDYDDPKFRKTHNFLKLFEALKSESKQLLNTEFKKTVLPDHPNFLFPDYGIHHLMYQNQNAFTDWRYFHEGGKSISFNHSEFEATLEMILREFKKRYRVVSYP